jgi:hypothetical protein
MLNVSPENSWWSSFPEGTRFQCILGVICLRCSSVLPGQYLLIFSCRIVSSKSLHMNVSFYLTSVPLFRQSFEPCRSASRPYGLFLTRPILSYHFLIDVASIDSAKGFRRPTKTPYTIVCSFHRSTSLLRCYTSQCNSIFNNFFNSIEQSPPWNANSRSADEISNIYVPEGSLPCSKEPALIVIIIINNNNNNSIQ